MEKHGIPEYINREQLIFMFDLIDEKRIDPQHLGCDMTLEMVAGVTPHTAIMTHIQRDFSEPSIYFSVYVDYITCCGRFIDELRK